MFCSECETHCTYVEMRHSVSPVQTVVYEGWRMSSRVAGQKPCMSLIRSD